ncbi:hypothetical protein TRFO_13883 [Tritrichomonas foetus]|uniref:Uncharacterized protein n=1 Tax=Tritrichomonas foetus TaxID=1144522 RepID=A0A1J4L182_9EUKA|nr:hypothetical protein TRFO_13883 [Tritrichomonas foetus]|eukprot:OHT15718.1 hypothetical protein TRFO_13883 [Tritrichomonas foetus]
MDPEGNLQDPNDMNDNLYDPANDPMNGYDDNEQYNEMDEMNQMQPPDDDDDEASKLQDFFKNYDPSNQEQPPEENNEDQNNSTQQPPDDSGEDELSKMNAFFQQYDGSQATPESNQIENPDPSQQQYFSTYDPENKAIPKPDQSPDDSSNNENEMANLQNFFNNYDQKLNEDPNQTAPPDDTTEENENNSENIQINESGENGESENVGDAQMLGNDNQTEMVAPPMEENDDNNENFNQEVIMPQNNEDQMMPPEDDANDNDFTNDRVSTPDISQRPVNEHGSRSRQLDTTDIAMSLLPPQNDDTDIDQQMMIQPEEQQMIMPEEQQMFDPEEQQVKMLNEVNEIEISPETHQEQQMIQPEEQQMIQPEEQQMIQPEEQQMIQPEEQQMIQPEEQQMIQPEEQQMIQPEEQQMIQPEEQQMIQPEEQQMIQPEEQQIMPMNDFNDQEQINPSDEETPQNEENNEETKDKENAPSEEGMQVTDTVTSSRILSTRHSSTKISLSKLPPLATSPELDAENRRLLKNFVNRGKLPDISSRVQLIQFIQREKVNSVVAQKFDEAQNYQNILQRYQKAITDQEVKDRNKLRLDNLDKKLNETKASIAKMNKETQEKIKEEKEKQKERRYELKMKQDEELTQFESRWNDQEFLKKFAKPSSRLLTMKGMERSMVLTKMFDQAEDIHHKVKELEKDESRIAQENAYREMDKERRKILYKQAQEMKIFEQHCARQIDIIKHDQEMKISSIAARQTKLESEIDEWKMNPPTALPPIASIIPDLGHQSVMTPRTVQRYSAYKKINKAPVISIKPLGKVKPKKRPRTAFSDTY